MFIVVPQDSEAEEHCAGDAERAATCSHACTRIPGVDPGASFSHVCRSCYCVGLSKSVSEHDHRVQLLFFHVSGTR